MKTYKIKNRESRSQKNIEIKNTQKLCKTEKQKIADKKIVVVVIETLNTVFIIFYQFVFRSITELSIPQNVSLLPIGQNPLNPALILSD